MTVKPGIVLDFCKVEEWFAQRFKRIPSFSSSSVLSQKSLCLVYYPLSLLLM